MNIRTETPQDIETIHRLTEAAFAPMSFSDGTEPDCIDKLRADGDLTLSLVAEEGGELIGHIAFSPALIDGEHTGWFGLGPVSVWPNRQKKGIGTALIETGLGMLRERGARGCVLIGNPDYYGRFGFVGDGRLAYRDLGPAFVQWLAFGEEKPSGTVTFSPGLE